MKNLVDCISISIQAYLLSRMMCNMLPVKEPKERSFMLAFLIIGSVVLRLHIFLTILHWRK